MKKKGPRPGSTTLELRTKKKDPDAPPSVQASSKWAATDPESELSEVDKRLLLSMVVKITTLQIFKHHCYQFDGVVYRQSKGGPIGLRFTSIVARLVMDHWLKVFLCAIVDAGALIHGIMKYVDDINLIMALLHLGMRWEDGTLTWKEEWLDKDIRDGRTAEDVTMVAMQQAADSILPWLQFTVDQPSNHGCAMVPVLDLQVWVKHPAPGTPKDQQHDVVGWCFYEKMTASNRVLRASSAYNWHNKLVTLNQEVFRRMRNCTRQLTVVARSDILKTYVAKLRRSGYVEATVRGVPGVRDGVLH